MPLPVPWLHNMSVPPNTTVTAAREPLDGLRFGLAVDAHWAYPLYPLREALAPCREEGPFAWALRLGLAGVAALVTLDDGPPGEAPTGLHPDIASMPVGSACTPSGPVLDVVAAIERARAHCRITAEALRGLCDVRLDAAGIPARSGVFVARDVADSAGPHIGFGATLAALSRRSGPLYLPRRVPQVGLIVPFAGTLFFPEA